nr:EFR1 family ferrodoxin [Clostridium sp. AM42-4]
MFIGSYVGLQGIVRGIWGVVFYFTATGNSLYVAKQLCEHPVSIAQAVHDKQKTYRAEQIGIVCPMFGHKVPRLVKEFLEQATFETPYFYMILTYGYRHGGASELAQQMLKNIGIHPAYINVLWMLDNFLPSFDMNKQKEMEKHVGEHLKQIREDIRDQRRFLSPVTAADRAAHQEFLSRKNKMPEGLLQNFYRITEKCIGCEICTRVCPEHCFHMEEHKSVWSPDRCMYCIQNAPFRL